MGRVQFIFAIQVSIFYPCNENNKISCSRWDHYCLDHIFGILSTPVLFVCCSLCWIWRISINWQWWKMILENIPSKLRWEKKTPSDWDWSCCSVPSFCSFYLFCIVSEECCLTYNLFFFLYLLRWWECSVPSCISHFLFFVFFFFVIVQSLNWWLIKNNHLSLLEALIHIAWSKYDWNSVAFV